MAYADLSQEQKSQLDAWSRDSRAFLGELQRVINKGVALRDAYYVSDGISDLFLVGGAWPDAEIVPNTSGLAGAAVQTKLDHVSYVSEHLDKLIADASSLTTGFNIESLRQQRTAAAGPTNVV